MARKNQRLINYHTSGVTSMPLASEVSLGEIVVRHADEKPELLLKKNNGDFAVMVDKVAVDSAITAAIAVSEGNTNDAIAEVKEAFSAHTSEFETYKTNAAADFATKGELSGAKTEINNAISSAKTEIYNSATTFATNAVGAAKNEPQGEIADLRSEIEKANSGSTEFEEFVEANYATSADTVSAITAAAEAAEAAANEYADDVAAQALADAKEFATSAVTAAKGELNGEIDAVAKDVAANAKAIEDAAKHLADTYATSAKTVDAIVVAKGEAISAATANTKSVGDAVYGSATTFATNAVSTAKSELQGEIDAVEEDVAANAKAIEDAAKHLADTYATSADTVSAITAAAEAAEDAANDYADGVAAQALADAKEFATSAVTAAKTELQGEIDDLEAALNSGITEIRGEVSAATDELTTLINNKVAVAYRYKGSCSYAELTGKTAEFVGEVWNVTDANGDFPAGTNYAWDGEKWDALGGSIDLTPYAKVADFEDYKDVVDGKFDEVIAEINKANSGSTEFEEEVYETFATSADTVTAIGVAKEAAIASAASYTDAEIVKVYGSATSYADSAVAAAKTELNGEIDAVAEDVADNVEAIKGVKATADAAIQTASIVDGETCKVSVEKVGTELQFNFSNLVIDCGDF
jgi:hypothetical protein